MAGMTSALSLGALPQCAEVQGSWAESHDGIPCAAASSCPSWWLGRLGSPPCGLSSPGRLGQLPEAAPKEATADAAGA